MAKKITGTKQFKGKEVKATIDIHKKPRPIEVLVGPKALKTVDKILRDAYEERLPKKKTTKKRKVTAVDNPDKYISGVDPYDSESSGSGGAVSKLPKDEIVSNVLMSVPSPPVHKQDGVTFAIIPNQQTPPAIEMTPIDFFLRTNAEVLKGVKMLAESYAGSKRGCRGLAANQCSLNGSRISLRFFIHNHHGAFRHIIDPVIVQQHGMKINRIEGCLTWDSQDVMAERYSKVVVSYYDIEGVYHEKEEFKGIAAQVFQHEINHLNGVKETLVGFDATITYPPSYKRNEPCPCGSGVKYKKCCK